MIGGAVELLVAKIHSNRGINGQQGQGYLGGNCFIYDTHRCGVNDKGLEFIQYASIYVKLKISIMGPHLDQRKSRTHMSMQKVRG